MALKIAQLRQYSNNSKFLGNTLTVIIEVAVTIVTRETKESQQVDISM
jgi:uncharacterized protein (DUF736 family)